MSADRPSVLIVDDEPELLNLLSEYLGDEYAVQTAVSGQEAVRYLDDSIDLVSLDRRMPGLSGDDVVQKIRDKGLQCSVIIMSAVREDEDPIECDVYLEKPIRRDEFRSTVRQLVQTT